jgi:glutathione-regulated potassium-efflux system protein KefB
MQVDNPLALALVFLVAAVIAVPLFNRLGLGAVLGYLVAGLAIGPDGFGFAADSAGTLHVAEFGVVFLLFVIGLELSPQRLWLMRRVVFGLGGAQVALTALAAGAAAWLWLDDWRAALVIGLALSLSSTAIGMQILGERKELGTEHGQQAFGVLLFQDVAAIPILALVPLLGAAATAEGGFSALGFARALGTIVAVIVGGRLLLPPLFRAVSRAGSVEVFSAAALLVVIGTALLMQLAGLSVTLGAFLAGVLLANSEFRHEIESHIEPFKGLLLGLFFMAVGMSIDLDLIREHPWVILVGVLAVYAIKAAVLAAIGAGPGRLALPQALLVAALIGQVGEFAFVILGEARKAALVDPTTYGLLLAIVGVSMALTPLAVMAANALGPRFAAKTPARAFDPMPDHDPKVIVAGFGRVGQIVSRVLSAQNIPHTVLEPSVEQVDFSRRFGSTLYYGDPSRPELLRAARADRATLFVVAIDDPELSLRTTRVVRRLFPHLKVLTRARNRQHVFKLMDLGVDGVVRETFHSSLELTRHVLEGLGMDAATAADRVRRFREHDEQMLRDQYLIHDDESALIQSAAEARAELARLFEADSGIGDAAARRAPD